MAPDLMDPSNPLFIHSSDHPGAQLISTPFSGIGFASWKCSMLIALTAKNKTGFINGNSFTTGNSFNATGRFIKTANGGGNAETYTKNEKNENKRVTFFCNHCKRAGHTEDRRWKKHGYPPNFKGANRNGNRRFAAVAEDYGTVDKEDNLGLLSDLFGEQCDQLMQILSHIQGKRQNVGAVKNKENQPCTSLANFAGPFSEEATGTW